MLEPPRKHDCTPHSVGAEKIGAPLGPASLDLEIQSSTPRGIKPDLVSLFKNDTIVRYLLATYGGHLDKIVVTGKKRGEPDVKVNGGVATVTVSPDAGSMRRFAQLLHSKARLLSTESDNGEKEPGQGDRDNLVGSSGAKYFTDRLIDLVQQWAREDFCAAPPKALAALLPTAHPLNEDDAEVQRASLARGLGAGQERTSRIHFSQFNESFEGLGKVILQPDLLKEVCFRYKHLCRQVSRPNPDYFDDAKLLDVRDLKRHAELIGTLAVVSFLRFLSDGRNRHFIPVGQAVQLLGALIENRYHQRVALAIERSEREPLENFVVATSELLTTWARGGVLGVLTFVDRRLTGGKDSTNQLFTGIAGYRDRAQQFLITHDELTQTEIMVGTDLSNRMLTLLRPCLPALCTPKNGDLRPFKEPLVAFGRELGALAQGGSPEHRKWYVTAFSRLLKETPEPSNDQKVDASPGYVLAMIKELVVWGSDPHDLNLAPLIFGSDQLLESVMILAAYEAGRATFEEMLNETSVMPLARLEVRSKLVQDLMGIVLEIPHLPGVALCATIVDNFAKYKLAVAKSAHFAMKGDLTLKKEFLMQGVQIARSCAEKIGHYPIKDQQEYATHLTDFFQEVVLVADQIEKEGEIGLALTALEPAVELLEHLGEKGELRARITKTIEGCINTLVDICRQMSEDTDYRTSNPDAVQFALDGVAEQLANWRATSRLAASRDYVKKHLSRATSLLKKGKG